MWWQGFGNPELRRGPSPFISSLKGVLKTGFLVGAGEHNSFPVQAGAFRWGERPASQGVQEYVKEVPRECVFFRVGR